MSETEQIAAIANVLTPRELAFLVQWVVNRSGGSVRGADQVIQLICEIQATVAATR